MSRRTYKGQLIFECERAPGEHPGKWIVQSYHSTGMPYSDELCAHYTTLAAAKAAITDALQVADWLTTYDAFTR